MRADHYVQVCIFLASREDVVICYERSCDFFLELLPLFSTDALPEPERAFVYSSWMVFSFKCDHLECRVYYVMLDEAWGGCALWRESLTQGTACGAGFVALL